jgi:DNA-binding LacI/PurR family transcriptional regulator
MRLEDVAKRAGVSPATVSRVVNNTGRVSAKTRARVLKVAEALRYRPDIRARALAAGKCRTLGLIVSNLQNPFFTDVFAAIEADAHDAGYAVALASTDHRPHKLDAAVARMLGDRVAGLALVLSGEALEAIDELLDETIPLAVYGAGCAAPNVTRVKTDYARGTEKALEYLYALGHRRLAFVGRDRVLTPLHERETSFLGTVARLSCGIESAVAHGSDSPAGGLEATRRLLRTGFVPSAILCASDFIALGVLTALREHGLAVPADVSVVGYDNIRLSEHTSPPLTTVDVPREGIGHAIASALLSPGAVAGGAPREVMVRPELIVRGSTGRLNPRADPGSVSPGAASCRPWRDSAAPP